MRLILLDPVIDNNFVNSDLQNTFIIISFIALLILILIFYLVKRKNKK